MMECDTLAFELTLHDIIKLSLRCSILLESTSTHFNASAFMHLLLYYERPSRIDYTKERYGGPFTTEQVEDVKTFVRILLFLVSLGPIFVMEVSSSILYLQCSVQFCKM